MAAPRRLGTESAKNRQALVAAAARVLTRDGYAAVSARAVAAEAGLKVPLVYYYFQTMDDLIRAVVQQNSGERLKRFVGALASADPLRALWELNTDPSAAIAMSELIAMAHHRESIRKEIVASARQFRSLQIEAAERLMAERGLDPGKYSPAGIVVIVTALARAMVQDRALGVADGYDEAVVLIERGLGMASAKS